MGFRAIPFLPGYRRSLDVGPMVSDQSGLFHLVAEHALPDFGSLVRRNDDALAELRVIADMGC